MLRKVKFIAQIWNKKHRSVFYQYLKNICLFCVWMFCLHASLCTTCVVLAESEGDQKRVLDPLELQVVVSTRNQTWVLWKRSVHCG